MHSRPLTLTTTRFKENTWECNQTFRMLHQIHTGCIYGSPQELPPTVLPNSIVFVVEMNNDNNQIKGIGMIRNRPLMDKYYNIYKDGNYNRFVYKGKYRLSRESLNEYNEELVYVIEHLVFHEKSHLKRGAAFTSITPKLFARKKDEKCKQWNLNKMLDCIAAYFKAEFLRN